MDKWADVGRSSAMEIPLFIGMGFLMDIPKCLLGSVDIEVVSPGKLGAYCH
jgi:hypothetical protein